MPATADTVACAARPVPTPRDIRHATEVPETHAVVWQLDVPMRLDGVASSAPKLTPETVTLNDAVATMFVSTTKLTTGAEQEVQQQARLAIGVSAMVHSCVVHVQKTENARRTVVAECMGARARHCGHSRLHILPLSFARRKEANRGCGRSPCRRKAARQAKPR